MAQATSFEIPADLVDFAEKNIQQARAACDQFMDVAAQAMTMWTTSMPPNALAVGFKSIQDRAIHFGKQNAKAYFALASELANAKDMTDAMALQSRYAQTQFQTYARQSQELGRLMAEVAQSIQPKS
jgi:hypothetical protein